MLNLPTLPELAVTRDEILGSLRPGSPHGKETLAQAACDVIEHKLAQRIEAAIAETVEVHEMLYGPVGPDGAGAAPLLDELRSLSPQIDADLLAAAFDDGRGWNEAERGQTAATLANALMALYTPAIGDLGKFLSAFGIVAADYGPAAPPAPREPVAAPVAAPKAEKGNAAIPEAYRLFFSAVDLDRKGLAGQLDISLATLNNYLTGRTAGRATPAQAQILRADIDARIAALNKAAAILEEN